MERSPVRDLRNKILHGHGWLFQGDVDDLVIEQALINRRPLLRTYDLQRELFESPDQVVLQPFTNKEKGRLKGVGYSIYSLTYQTIKTQKEMGKSIAYFSNFASKVENAASMVGEVAFNPKHIFFTGSNERSLYEQEALIEGSGIALRKRLNLPHHIRTIIGSAADYTQLILHLLEEMGPQSFREKYGLNLIRTNTLIANSHVAVGFFTFDQGVPVYKCHDSVRLENLFAAPLVVSIKNLS